MTVYIALYLWAVKEAVQATNSLMVLIQLIELYLY